MPNKLLLPNKYKFIGWFLLIPATIFGVILSFNDFEGFPLNANVLAIVDFSTKHLFSFAEQNITNTLTGICFIAGALLVGFSKEKKEDEFIEKLRLSSLLWAVWVSYILLFLAFIFVYGGLFFNVMVYN